MTTVSYNSKTRATNKNTNNIQDDNKVQIAKQIKQIIGKQAKTFQFLNKALLKEAQLNKSDLETVIIQKDEISNLDEIKKQYFEKVDDLRKTGLKLFKVREYEQCYNVLDEIIKTASYAYDLETLRVIYQLRALISIYFDDYIKAINDFKQMRQIADDEENYVAKMEAYDNLGKCYSHIKNYENAIKCYKKQLELAWFCDDTQAEIRSYEQLGIQYYYLGNLEKAKYYDDRCMRGKCEKKDSKIRVIYENYNESRSISRERLTFKKLKDILSSFNQIENALLRSLKKKIIAQTYGTGTLCEPEDFFRNGLLQNERPMRLDVGSPISTISMTRLPSPRLIIENERIKNAYLLPYYDKQDESYLNKKDRFLMQVAKNLAKRTGGSKTGQVDQTFQNEINIINKSKFKDNSVLLKFRQQREASRNIKGEVDMKQVIRSAKMNNEKKQQFIAINHLSPNRNIRHYKETEELKEGETELKFVKFENELRENIAMTENKAININNLTEDQAIKLLQEKKPIVKKQVNNGLKLFNIFKMPKNVDSISNMDSQIGDSSNALSKVPSVVNVKVLASMKNPQNARIRRYNQQVCDAIAQSLNQIKQNVSEGQQSTDRLYQMVRQGNSQQSLYK